MSDENDERPTLEEEQEDEVDGIEIEFTTVNAARLKAFSDAVWSIIATIMIVPTIHVSISERITANSTVISEKGLVHDTLPDIGLYILAFLMICSTWSCHVWTFQTMDSVTDFSILINLVVLLFGSFLPYFYSLMSRFHTWKTVMIYCSLHISIALLQVITVFHAFSYPNLLTKKLSDLSDDEKKETKYRLLRRLSVIPSFALLAICLSFLAVNAATVCLAMIPVYPWMQSLIVYLIRLSPRLSQLLRPKRRREPRQVLLTERVKNERIEAFSDGVFAITSTLLVLDISEKYLPTKKEVKEHYDGNLMSSLAHVQGVFISYVIAFLIIGNIWYAQIHLFKNFHQISRLMMFINNWLLACVGMIPLAFTFILHYQVQVSLIVGVRFGCIVVFMASVFKTLMYCVGLLFEKYSEGRWVSMSAKRGGDDFGYTMFHLVAPAMLSLIVLGITFVNNRNASVYAGGAAVGLYTIALVSWKSVKATFFDEQDNHEFTRLSTNRPFNYRSIE